MLSFVLLVVSACFIYDLIDSFERNFAFTFRKASVWKFPSSLIVADKTDWIGEQLICSGFCVSLKKKTKIRRSLDAFSQSFYIIDILMTERKPEREWDVDVIISVEVDGQLNSFVNDRIAAIAI